MMLACCVSVRLRVVRACLRAYVMCMRARVLFAIFKTNFPASVHNCLLSSIVSPVP